MVFRDEPNLIDYDSLVRSWERGAPWHRRILARIGIQGKLIIAFSTLLLLTVIGIHLIFISGARQMMNRISDTKTIDVAQSVATAAQPAMLNHDYADLVRISRDMLTRPDALAIAFYDAHGNPVYIAPNNSPALFARLHYTIDTTQAIHQKPSLHHGRINPQQPCILVTAPIYNLSGAISHPGTGVTDFTNPDAISHPSTDTPAHPDSNTTTHADISTPQPRPIGYISVIRSSWKSPEYLQRTPIIISLFGLLVLALSLPIIMILVRRILYPVRQLVAATRQIAAGNLDAEVAIHRPDTIGALARSFNEMTLRIKAQKEQLARANEELAAANRDLEQRIRQRTMQLVQANQKLNSEAAEKEDFLRAVSHDLNAPLRNIAGMANMLIIKYRDSLTEDALYRLERIKKNTEVETDLIGELLELSRLKTRRQKMEPIDLQPLLDEVAGLFENDLRNSGIQLIFDTPLPAICAERSRFRQIFQNLIDNAIKYMGTGAIDPTTGQPRREIHIGCYLHKSQPEFYVSDTGMGIEPQDADKVFFVFRRGRQRTTQAIAGRGVGLASVKSIIEMYGGTIRLRSTPQQGSTFYFTIDPQYLRSGIFTTPDTQASFTSPTHDKELLVT